MAGLVIVDNVGRGEMKAVHIAEQVIWKSEISAGGVDAIDLQFTLRRSKVQEVIGSLQELIAELETMTTLEPAQVFDEVPGLCDLVLRPPRRGADAGEPIDLDGRQAGSAGVVRNS